MLRFLRCYYLHFTRHSELLRAPFASVTHMLYLVLKALHLSAVVAWFAGLFYLPRLFVYHAGSSSSEVVEQLRVMELRLYRYIMNPAMAAVYILGFALLAQQPHWFSFGWLHIKLGLVILLSGYHISLGRMLRRMQSEPAGRSPDFFRWYNEIPTVVLVAVMLLAIVKPF